MTGLTPKTETFSYIPTRRKVLENAKTRQEPIRKSRKSASQKHDTAATQAGGCTERSARIRSQQLGERDHHRQQPGAVPRGRTDADVGRPDLDRGGGDIGRRSRAIVRGGVRATDGDAKSFSIFKVLVLPGKSSRVSSLRSKAA